ncbi:response regulator [Luteimicrobium subarcticum]|uniref:LuxR family two component transcriptional regulator n=1 Tax=Luteimicrobium subarcticum TaxID=620910 RepID=A0A2M8WS93_9MICO|nr:response regulator transcription factor [Luteimicrobium subarcticum]PJI93788.1 LuxR family two component transcriptional regulator [Luteimicrobium subarcticum]
MDEPITVLLADDHPVVRSGLRALLDSLPGIEVAGEAVDGADAVEQVGRLRPDVVLMDVSMPGMDGIEATRRVVAAVPSAAPVAVLMLTMYDDEDTVFGAVRAGARGYLLKGAEQAEIERAVRGVVAGEAVFGPGVAERVLALFAAGPGPVPRGSDVPFPELTEREREILELVAQGKRNAAIAAELFLAPKTVANNVSSIFVKLAVTDRSAAIVRAREGGLGQADPAGHERASRDGARDGRP